MIKVLVIDDSALVCQILTAIIDGVSGMEVIGTASDPYVAREKIKRLKPDVLTLDVEMPRMDGITFLGNLMRLHPMPVVMISSLTEKGADITLRALELGAIDFIPKPTIDLTNGLETFGEEIIEKIRVAAQARVTARSADTVKFLQKKYTSDAVLARPGATKRFKTTDKIIAIGSSTGGTEAIKNVLLGLPPNMPGIVVSQHIPEAFSASFANRLNSHTVLTVCEAREGQRVLPGHVYIAPGKRHLLVERDGSCYVCRLYDGKPVNRHKPSVDVMFRSMAQNVGRNGIALLLTGMGDDGAIGMDEMKQAGAVTIVQDEMSSVVWGMPREAVKRGVVDEIISLNKIAERLQELGLE
ncbi:MAG: chemotaxis response regulator protein-glutamate methylesterase [Gammaproteobacteria bacterium]|nr:chemotaxis response regulator protein-glutamate methylesterase [Gammaproteobacteria bacterium]